MNSCYQETPRNLGAVMDEWLASSKRKLKPTTYATYETVLSRHIRPALGGISPEELSDWAMARFWEKKRGRAWPPRPSGAFPVCSAQS